MTCNTPRKGDRITVFAKVVSVDNAKCTVRPWAVQVEGSKADPIWITGDAVDRIIERPVGVGDKVTIHGGFHVYNVLAIDNGSAWVKSTAACSHTTVDVGSLRRAT